MADKINDSILSVQLRTIVGDVEHRMPNLREPDPLSDWGAGVVWMLDRLTNIADDNARGPQPMPAVAQHGTDEVPEALAESLQVLAGMMISGSKGAVLLQEHKLYGLIHAIDRVTRWAEDPLSPIEPMPAVAQHPSQTLDRAIAQLRERFPNGPVNAWTAGWLSAAAEIAGEPWEEASSTREMAIRLENHQQLVNTLSAAEQSVYGSQRAYDTSAVFDHPARLNRLVAHLKDQTAVVQAQLDTANGMREARGGKIVLVSNVLAEYWEKYAPDGAATDYDLPERAQRLLEAADHSWQRMKDSRDQLSKRATELDRQLAEARREPQNLEGMYDRLSAAQSRATELSERLASVQSDFSDVATQRDRAREERDELKTQVESLTRMNDSLTEDAEAATHARQEAVRAAAELERERNELKSRVEELERTRTTGGPEPTIQKPEEWRNATDSSPVAGDGSQTFDDASQTPES